MPLQQGGKEWITSFHATLYGLPSRRIQPGNKTQDSSSSAGQPAEPEAEAGVIPNLLPDKATSKAATNLLRFGACAPPASEGSTRV